MATFSLVKDYFSRNIVAVPRFLESKIDPLDYELRLVNKRATPGSYFIRSPGGVIRHVTLHPTKGWRSTRYRR